MSVSGRTLLGLFLVNGIMSTAALAQSVNFARQIQPLLARRCFACHGPDKGESGLRLHLQASATKAADSGGRAVVPKHPERSVLLERVASMDPDTRMPPEGKPLTETEVDLLRRWIAEGADWQEHWAFQRVKRHEPPQVKAGDRVSNPIDQFVLSKLEDKGMSLSAPAEKRALLRRVTHSLTGLPPTPKEYDDFLRDASANAYEKVVDRLLQSPKFGEKWARHWLDIVRFAETNSFERDSPKPFAWRYRDYVIKSMNDDKPYDLFLKEQLAGDEMPAPSAEAIIATGFYRLGIWDDEPADPALAHYDGFDDLVTTTGQAMLGLTVNCARCHDHKIDPITQKDYYGLVAFFRGVQPYARNEQEQQTPVFATAEDRHHYEASQQALNARRAEQQEMIDRFEAKVRTELEKQSEELPSRDLEDLEYRFYRDTWATLPNFDLLKAETVAPAPRPLFDIGLATREDFFGFVWVGNLVVPRDGTYRFQVDADDGVRVSVNRQEIVLYDGIHGVGKPRTATIELAKGRVPIRVEYFQGRYGKDLIIQWSGPGFEPRYLTPPPAGKRGKRDKYEIKDAEAKFLTDAERMELLEARQRLDKLKKERPKGTYALCVHESGPTAQETFVLQRGSPQAPTTLAPPAYIAVLDPKPAVIPEPAADAKTTGRRTVLANWIASADNPMTSRVMVNRLWQHHFGRGIVRSPNNFGQLGDPPTHPELLDWLADEFVKSGWKLKALHKQMVMSSTYRQASVGNEAGLNADPNNDLFWRANARRLSAEEIRDSILAVNGTLNEEMYGPGVYPAIPQEVLAGQSRPGAGWGKATPREAARRSIYIHVKRSLITPLLSTFDFPETDVTCEARFTTTQPGQALSMLNSDFMQQQAQHFADRIRRDRLDESTQIAWAIELTTGRPATPADVQRGQQLLTRLRAQHQLTADAAFVNFCLVVLNLNEFLYVD